MDFLFSYYAYPPARIVRWSPGLGVVLEGAAARDFLTHPAYREEAGGVAVAAEALPEHRRHGAAWVRDLLRATAGRPAHFGCFALHEWAMVYRADERRHAQLPLRVDADELAGVVEGAALCCTHFDAFRFFTPAAAPRNRRTLTRAGQADQDQPGCLHANMDLYKWAMKFQPWITADLLADAFLLAVRIREVDMRASPYDVLPFGLAPIRIELPEGRAEFQGVQQALAAEAASLRGRLQEAFERLCAEVGL
jgi:hypothetical protein